MSCLVWKRCTSACRSSALATSPSMRQYASRMALTPAWGSREWHGDQGGAREVGSDYKGYGLDADLGTRGAATARS